MSSFTEEEKIKKKYYEFFRVSILGVKYEENKITTVKTRK